MLSLTGLFIVAGVWSWSWMQKPTSFPIKTIQFEGQLIHENPTQIVRVLQSQMTGGFFSLNVTTAKQTLLALPWVAGVSFRRVWPDTLTVKITEQDPVARFGKKGLLNKNGVVFYPDVNSIPMNLPDLEGTVDQAPLLFGFYQTVSAMVNKLGLSVIALHLDAEGNWNLQLSNQLKVVLGHEDALIRFQRFIAIYPKIVASSVKTLALVDLRYPNGVAVQFQKNQNTLKK